MAKELNKCLHCGSKADFVVDRTGTADRVLVRCAGCMIQTQFVVATIDFSAKDKAAEVWNVSKGGEKS